MKTDSLNRRLRFDKPNPKVKRILPQEADFLLFEAISRHGPLPTHYLYAFTRHLRKDYSQLQNRLTEFYNGDEDGPYLTRPPQQFAGFKARYQHSVYDLAPRAKIALAERGTPAQFSPKRTDPFLHQLMGACVGASLEIIAPRHGLRYVPREEILTHAKCPIQNMAVKLPEGKLIPDDLFALENAEGKKRYFAVEIDRNTESIKPRKFDHNTFGKKIAGYKQVMDTGMAHKQWGFHNLHILTVTTNHTHAKNILDYVQSQGSKKLTDRFYIAVEPNFGANWRVPKEILEHLFSDITNP